MWDCFLWLLSLLQHRSLESVTESKNKDFIEQQSLDCMTESKTNDVIEQQKSYLSDDLIIYEILTRLPIKSILRFKSVSKPWYSALSSSKFASFHLRKFPLFHPSAPVSTLFIKSSEDCYLYNCDDDDDQIFGNFEDKLVKLDADFVVKNYLRFTGCCDGLICLSQLYCEYFFLWNPATHKLHKYVSDEYVQGIRFDATATGFGYASSDDDYKYVGILTSSWLRKQASTIAHIFSLRKNKWRKIDFDHVVYYPSEKSVLLNEKLYWVSYCNIGTVIVCFDLGLEKFDIIKVSLHSFARLGFMGACLSECEYDSTDGREDLIKQILGSAIIEKSIYHLPKELLVDWWSSVIAYTRTGSFFVTGKFDDGIQVSGSFWGCRMLWLVDTSMKSMQYKTLLKSNEQIEIARYVPSLVSPFLSEFNC